MSTSRLVSASAIARALAADVGESPAVDAPEAAIDVGVDGGIGGPDEEQAAIMAMTVAARTALISRIPSRRQMPGGLHRVTGRSGGWFPGIDRQLRASRCFSQQP